MTTPPPDVATWSDWTYIPPGDSFFGESDDLVAAGTSEGARKAWESRGSSSAGDVADRIRADHPGVTLELVDKVHGDPHWELDRLIVPVRGEGELTQAADDAGMPIALTPEPIGSGSRTALERFYRRHGFLPNRGRNKLASSKEAMVRYPKGSS